jgi:hypothetical protein
MTKQSQILRNGMIDNELPSKKQPRFSILTLYLAMPSAPQHKIYGQKFLHVGFAFRFLAFFSAFFGFYVAGRCPHLPAIPRYATQKCIKKKRPAESGRPFDGWGTL